MRFIIALIGVVTVITGFAMFWYDLGWSSGVASVYQPGIITEMPK